MQVEGLVMGETRVDAEICGQKKYKELRQVLVDTGSITTVLSKIDSRDIKPIIVGKQAFITPKGLLEAPIGMARVRFAGADVWTPIAVAEEEEVPTVIGAITLELARFKVNPVSRQLEPLPPISRI